MKIQRRRKKDPAYISFSDINDQGISARINSMAVELINWQGEKCDIELTDKNIVFSFCDDGAYKAVPIHGGLSISATSLCRYLGYKLHGRFPCKTDSLKKTITILRPSVILDSKEAADEL